MHDGHYIPRALGGRGQLQFELTFKTSTVGVDAYLDVKQKAKQHWESVGFRPQTRRRSAPEYLKLSLDCREAHGAAHQILHNPHRASFIVWNYERQDELSSRLDPNFLVVHGHDAIEGETRKASHTMGGGRG